MAEVVLSAPPCSKPPPLEERESPSPPTSPALSATLPLPLRKGRDLSGWGGQAKKADEAFIPRDTCIRVMVSHREDREQI